MSRTAVRWIPVPLLGTLALLAGCAGEPREARAVTSRWGFMTAPDLTNRIEKTVAAGNWSALMNSRTDLDGRPAVELSGRVNLGNTMTGSLKLVATTPEGSVSASFVVTTEGVWSLIDGESTYYREDVRVLGDDPSTEDFSGFAKALLYTGSEVIKGRETVEPGVDTVRLSGRLTPDDLGVISGSFYADLQEFGVTSVDADVWVDEEGRIRKSEQTLNAGREKLHTVVTFSEPGPSIQVKAPAWREDTPRPGRITPGSEQPPPTTDGETAAWPRAGARSTSPTATT